MTNYKLLALTLAVITATGAIAGGATMATLSDGVTVTTLITVGNGSVGNAGNVALGAGNSPLDRLDITTEVEGDSGDSGDGTTASVEWQQTDFLATDHQRSEPSGPGFGAGASTVPGG